jgi:hypothetical protein
MSGAVCAAHDTVIVKISESSVVRSLAGGQRSLRTSHGRHRPGRLRVADGKVQRPRHFLICRFDGDTLVIGQRWLTPHLSVCVGDGAFDSLPSIRTTTPENES